jgi:CRISPR/Cas system CSM-associated protein Csm2 small subunit
VNAVKNLFSDQEKHAERKDGQWENIVMMFAKAMHQRNTTYRKRKKDHEILEHVVLNNVDTKDGQTADDQW